MNALMKAADVLLAGLESEVTGFAGNLGNW